jgi:hypothetical protein
MPTTLKPLEGLKASGSGVIFVFKCTARWQTIIPNVYNSISTQLVFLFHIDHNMKIKWFGFSA